MHAFAAYRKIVRIPATLKSVDPFHLVAPPDVTSVWWNGRPIKGKPHPSGKYFEIPRNATEYDDANWLVIGLEITNVNRNTEFKIPAIVCGKHVVTLKDAWEWRPAAKSFADASRIYLPAKFGGKPEILIEVQ